MTPRTVATHRSVLGAIDANVSHPDTNPHVSSDEQQQQRRQQQPSSPAPSTASHQVSSHVAAFNAFDSPPLSSPKQLARCARDDGLVALTAVHVENSGAGAGARGRGDGPGTKAGFSATTAVDLYSVFGITRGSSATRSEP